MGYQLLADAVLVVHLAFILFVVFGGFVAWRWRQWVWWHVPVLAWGIYIEISGTICPLTPLENKLRRLGGSAGFDGGFIDHYLLPLIYPPGLTQETQWILAFLLILLNSYAYFGLWKRRSRSISSA